MVQFMKTRAEMVYPLNPDDDELVVPVVFAANYTGHPELDLAGKYTFAPVYVRRRAYIHTHAHKAANTYTTSNPCELP